MNREQAEQRIAAVQWYHDFDFGNGLIARAQDPHSDLHRGFWRFIENELDAIDFRDKTVLDVGCWDGYWSFYAEKRGARSVLASDDQTQNWSASAGLLLARELLNSQVEVNLQLSMYQLASLNRTFDVILCLGVYYHLFDPFYAFAQMRHCCHPETIVVVEGSEAFGLPLPQIVYNPRNYGSKFTPTAEALQHLLEATYFRVEKKAERGSLDQPVEAAPPSRLGWWWRLRMSLEALRGSRQGMNDLYQQVFPGGYSPRRLLWVCRPYEGLNELHQYRPPFGLDTYDPRFRTLAAA